MFISGWTKQLLAFAVSFICQYFFGLARHRRTTQFFSPHDAEYFQEVSELASTIMRC